MIRRRDLRGRPFDLGMSLQAGYAHIAKFSSIVRFPQPFLPKALPLPKHQLPARPPAEVCVRASAVAPSVTSPTSQKSHRLHFDTMPAMSAHAEHAEQLGKFPENRASPSPTSDLAPSRDVHDDLDGSTDAPFCPDASRYISSPSVSNPDEIWQEFVSKRRTNKVAFRSTR
ncbi:uncharacterized protein BDW47DRAFT_113620 [Aspergillus candidus]|uniref:Uncharacterized protein n=1 Tax=Aspergillus candidus TaxID=41067 RepID=A0A2I2EZ29_ASPCN|nr:hypothetical protein BDW47DRAFT_113620 [Aspergillus candidus]PLB33626.1 hypothetical protein BDW47DRAFT_113620 [Aspergillus candidus]